MSSWKDVKRLSLIPPTSLMMAGPSGCGKTVFTTRLLLENNKLFMTPPNTVHYCYGSWQQGFETLKKGGVKFHEGVPDSSLLPRWFPEGGILILDDLRNEGGNVKRSWTYLPNILTIKTSP